MKKRIYVVEDNDDIRDLVQYILTDEHYDVNLYATANEFNKVLAISLPDLILLDIRLPDGNGIEICKKLKCDPATAHIPVLLMSANTRKSELMNEVCAVDFISKPFDIDDFKNRVEYYL